jgi:hypothetical protein
MDLDFEPGPSVQDSAAFVSDEVGPTEHIAAVMVSPNGHGASASVSSAYTPAASLVDPVAALVVSLIDGQGELSQTELRRLELFRPERVLEAVAELSEKLAARGKESKRSRLNKIRLHAETMRSAAASEQLEVAGQPSANGDGPEWAAPAENPSDLMSGRDELPNTAGVEQDLWPAAEADPHFWPAAAEEARAPVPDDHPSSLAAPPAHDADWPDPGQIEHEVWDSWPTEDGDTTHHESRPADELSFPVVEAEMPLVEMSLPPQESQRPVGEEATGSEATEDHLGSLDLAIDSAEDVLALPVRERCDAVAFLDTPELARILAVTDEPSLRRAVVDQLERLATPESLGAINLVLEDPDLDLQLYAVNAAERLLARL